MPRTRISAAGTLSAKGDPLVTVADTTGPFRFFGNPSINNVGGVAFVAFLMGEAAASSPADPVGDEIVATGDAFFGLTIVDFGSLQGVGLNGFGQIAFFARLALTGPRESTSLSRPPTVTGAASSAVKNRIRTPGTMGERRDEARVEP